MCGISGIYNFDRERIAREDIIINMTDKIQHRGPDDSACYVDGHVGLGFVRLSIIDLSHGMQPFFSPDKSIVLTCNGEIYNYKELRSKMEAKGHIFKTNCDIEVLVYLYMEYGVDFLNMINGQFAFCLYDKKKEILFMARDHFGICPLFYANLDNALVYGSEIKAVLEHPDVSRRIDYKGLDQIFTFPANIAPITFFDDVKSLEPGHYAILRNNKLETKEYWNLDYPTADYDYGQKSEEYYIENLNDLLLKSIQYRLNADVPVGFYLSGGLDSSLTGGMMRHLDKSKEFNSFSICFSNVENKDINEQRYQRLLSEQINSRHNEIEFGWDDFETKLRDVIYYSESPLKETYNICSIALSERAKREKIKVVLSGEGADELFGGYAGYKFDGRREGNIGYKDLEHLREDEVRKKLWGNPDFIYEKNENVFRESKQAIYSSLLNKSYQDFDCLQEPAIDHTRIKGRHHFHQRSYVDFKLRLGGHLIADHGDRMTLANNVEGRYPFLDIDLINFVKTVPPSLMVKNMEEKYILKKVAQKYVPSQIINREKFGFVAPGSPQLLKTNSEWINDLLSYDRIKRQGYFNPDTIERLKKMYSRDGFILNPPYDLDLLIIVLTFNMFIDIFDVPNA
ncbi:asparagine synthase (glutamine-hydrolyzing) [Flavobacterium aestivum]|uniref:asparagine synthase (glutamine-hydrolyzing) n=1 Tax=Flavobacterium aestivum TaxID=3003257 RepID=UPI002482BCFD|nr:asparagine synthase (glutamine-hydrolyzing) [Flavobacterium aestivum]